MWLIAGTITQWKRRTVVDAYTWHRGARGKERCILVSAVEVDPVELDAWRRRIVGLRLKIGRRGAHPVRTVTSSKVGEIALAITSSASACRRLSNAHVCFILVPTVPS